jgi:hypothetical protein
MSETEHTPGPWGIERTATTLWVGPMRRDGSKCADVVCHFDVDSLTPEATKRNTANARLIAAAPDLLAALVDVVSIHEQVECAYAPAPCACDRYAQARAAIALAKGGAR